MVIASRLALPVKESKSVCHVLLLVIKLRPLEAIASHWLSLTRDLVEDTHLAGGVSLGKQHGDKMSGLDAYSLSLSHTCT